MNLDIIALYLLILLAALWVTPIAARRLGEWVDGACDRIVLDAEKRAGLEKKP